jgi:hypothetical protein
MSKNTSDWFTPESYSNILLVLSFLKIKVASSCGTWVGGTQRHQLGLTSGMPEGATKEHQ